MKIQFNPEQFEKAYREIEEEAEKDVGFPSIVSLKTSSYVRGSRVITSKELYSPKRLNKGTFSYFEQTLSEIGPEELLNLIENLYDCEDGLYEFSHKEISTDWETGCMEVMSYQLIPYKTIDKD